MGPEQVERERSTRARERLLQEHALAVEMSGRANDAAGALAAYEESLAIARGDHLAVAERHVSGRL
jgi:hypothetical protein